MRLMDEAGFRRAVAARSAESPRVVVTGNFATPQEALRLVDDELPSYRLFALNAQPGMPDRPGVVHETPFVGPGVRDSARLAYVPARLSLVPRLFADSHVPDVVLLHTTPPRAGRVSLGVEVNILPAAVEQVRRRGGLVLAQVNPRMPWTYGDGELSTDLVDVALEVDAPLLSPHPRALGDVEESIGEQVAALVPESATLQLGIGAVPDATLASLQRRKGLRIWSEMLSDGVVRLDQQGALDRDEHVVASFMFGSAELYSWAAANPRVRMLRTEATNDPAQIARRPWMTSINSALQVDLFGQANASWVRGAVYSGFGGQSDFVVGALHAPGGRAVIALPSWHREAGVSTIVPALQGPVTSFQHSFVVTEQGTAAIWPCTAQEQANHLLQVAHPDARESLAEVVAASRSRASGPGRDEGPPQE
jgi:acyl-CoA hydrolase